MKFLDHHDIYLISLTWWGNTLFKTVFLSIFHKIWATPPLHVKGFTYAKYPNCRNCRTTAQHKSSFGEHEKTDVRQHTRSVSFSYWHTRLWLAARHFLPITVECHCKKIGLFGWVVFLKNVLSSCRCQCRWTISTTLRPVASVLKQSRTLSHDSRPSLVPRANHGCLAPKFAIVVINTIRYFALEMVFSLWSIASPIRAPGVS